MPIYSQDDAHDGSEYKASGSEDPIEDYDDEHKQPKTRSEVLEEWGVVGSPSAKEISRVTFEHIDEDLEPLRLLLSPSTTPPHPTPPQPT